MKNEMTMKKLTLNDPETRSLDGVAENIRRLKELFPELVTEGPNGAAVNVDVLKTLVGDATVTDADEKYGLNWHGKRRARQLALTPSTGTLRPCPEDSVDWDTTQNLMIEGDNLEVLKLLQKSYAGKVKLIYIDPPYNTGKDFVYPDNFQDTIKNYLALTGQIEEARKISSNTEASGRFHTDWLNMLYPRLCAARILLSRDGVIAISIDDAELSRLISLVEQVFGEENLINIIAVKSSETSGVKMSHVDKRLPKIKEYIVIACRNREAARLNPIVIEKADDPEKFKKYLGYYGKIISNPSDPVDQWRIVTVEEEMREKGIEPGEGTVAQYKIANAERVVYRTNSKACEGLRFPTPTAEVISPSGVRYIWWEGKQMLFLGDYLKESLCDLWIDISTINLNKEACEVEGFGKGQKPLALVTRLLQLVTGRDSNDLVMDFFAGSGTTGHAVIAQNAADGGNRRYILVQLPEPLDPDNKDQKVAADFCDKIGKPRNIAELTKERLRRAAKKIKDENPMFAGDLGFRVFKLDSSNIRPWEPDSDNLEQTLLDSMEHIKADRTETDVLYELLIKLGLDLCVPIETRTFADKEVHSVGGGVLMACLAPKIERTEVEALAQGIVDWHKALAPAGDTTCVFRDSAFADDVAKTNMAAILEQHGITNVRSL